MHCVVFSSEVPSTSHVLHLEPEVVDVLDVAVSSPSVDAFRLVNGPGIASGQKGKVQLNLFPV